MDLDREVDGPAVSECTETTTWAHSQVNSGPQSAAGSFTVGTLVADIAVMHGPDGAGT